MSEAVVMCLAETEAVLRATVAGAPVASRLTDCEPLPRLVELEAGLV